jgi:hypothetical protein
MTGIKNISLGLDRFVQAVKLDDPAESLLIEFVGWNLRVEATYSRRQMLWGFPEKYHSVQCPMRVVLSRLAEAYISHGETSISGQ